jgi:hypothetical protein
MSTLTKSKLSAKMVVVQSRHRPTTGKRRFPSVGQVRGRRGVATLDYILVLGVVLPILAIVIPQGRRMMQLVFEMTCALVSWPFM